MSHDLMYGAEVKALVRRAYRNLPATTAAVAHKIYSDTELAAVPRTAVDRALGVANHLRFAGIQPAETILDIGCGAGIDTILAAQRTGPAGRVIALDLLPEILTQPAAWAGCIAGALAEEDFARKLLKAGFTQVEVLHREPLGIDDCALYPLFTSEVIRLMRELIPAARHSRVAVAIVVRANCCERQGT